LVSTANTNAAFYATTSSCVVTGTAITTVICNTANGYTSNLASPNPACIACSSLLKSSGGAVLDGGSYIATCTPLAASVTNAAVTIIGTSAGHLTCI